MVSKRVYALIFVVVLAVAIGFTIREGSATTVIPRTGGVQAGELQLKRSLRVNQAEAARWNALAAGYTASQTARSLKVIQSEAARWNALAAGYIARQAEKARQTQAAEAARWQAMADDHFARQTREAPSAR